MKRILIVDDEQDIVESLKFVLEVAGYACYCAYNGEDGLRMAKELSPDLIILDVMMPKINGYKISRLLKYDKKYKDIPKSRQCQINRHKKTAGMKYFLIFLPTINFLH